MSCPHTETTAILAAFGEAPPDFEDHLQQCPACLAVVQQHTSTLAAIEPLIAVQRAPEARWSPPAIGFLIAATALLAFQFMPGATVSEQAPLRAMAQPQAQAQAMEVDLFDDPIDQSLTSLELQLELFHLEES